MPRDTISGFVSMSWRNPDVPPKRYQLVRDGEPFDITLPYRLLLQCCECGVVHEVRFKQKGEKVSINMRPLKAETKRVRGQSRVKRNIRKLDG